MVMSQFVKISLMSTKFQIYQNTTLTPPMVYLSAWRREQKAGSGGIRQGHALLSKSYRSPAKVFVYQSINKKHGNFPNL
jgi:hypothetical protein